MIELKNFTKKYGDFLAVDDMNLTVNDGEIFGLIGHNGAGKSTTIKSIVSILEPTSGEIFVNGIELAKNRDEVKKMIGYVADSPDMFLNLDAYMFWDLIGHAYGMNNADIERRTEELCNILELKDIKGRAIEEFSHGMRQKVFVVAALMTNPSVWILDEPMTGLDPQASFNLKNMMKNHAKQGNTVLFSTHVLEVAEQLCDRIGILRKGKLLYLGTVDNLKDTYGDIPLEEIYLSMIKGCDEQ